MPSSAVESKPLTDAERITKLEQQVADLADIVARVSIGTMGEEWLRKGQDTRRTLEWVEELTDVGTPDEWLYGLWVYRTDADMRAARMRESPHAS